MTTTYKYKKLDGTIRNITCDNKKTKLFNLSNNSKDTHALIWDIENNGWKTLIIENIIRDKGEQEVEKEEEQEVEQEQGDDEEQEVEQEVEQEEGDDEEQEVEQEEEQEQGYDEEQEVEQEEEQEQGDDEEQEVEQEEEQEEEEIKNTHKLNMFGGLDDYDADEYIQFVVRGVIIGCGLSLIFNLLGY